MQPTVTVVLEGQSKGDVGVPDLVLEPHSPVVRHAEGGGQPRDAAAKRQSEEQQEAGDAVEQQQPAEEQEGQKAADAKELQGTNTRPVDEQQPQPAEEQEGQKQADAEHMHVPEALQSSLERAAAQHRQMLMRTPKKGELDVVSQASGVDLKATLINCLLAVTCAGCASTP